MKQPRQQKTIRLHVNRRVPKLPDGRVLGWTVASDGESIDLKILAYRKIRVRRLAKKHHKG